MNRRTRFLHNSTLLLAGVSTVLLVFNMVAIRVFRQEVFFGRYAFSGVEMLIATGFASVLLFDVLILLRAFLKLRQSQDLASGEKATLILGVFCLFFLIGDKVLIDEIGRECLLGWEVLGEWIILYLFLTTQLIYSLFVFRRLLRMSPVGYGRGGRSPLA